MIYIGKHQTADINDAYMGSSPYLSGAIQKYGIDKFKKEILFDFDNYDDMTNKEIELVNEEFIRRKDTYNVLLGGNGGWNAINDKPYKWICNPFLNINKKFYDEELTQQMKDAGWTYGTLVNKALSTIITDIDGKTITLRDFSNKHNLNENLVKIRYKAGWTTDELLNIPESYGYGIHKTSYSERYIYNKNRFEQ